MLKCKYEEFKRALQEEGCVVIGGFRIDGKTMLKEFREHFDGVEGGDEYFGVQASGSFPKGGIRWLTLWGKVAWSMDYYMGESELFITYAPPEDPRTS